MTTSRPSIVYIAGYGRSGSTLLERVLTAHPRMFGYGEVANLLRLWNDSEYRCACGMRLHECPVWGPAVEVCRRLDDPAAMLRIQAAWESWNGWRVGRAEAAACGRFVQQVLEALAPSIDDAWMIDSSKTTFLGARRPDRLVALGYDVRVLHMVRDPRACAWSNVRGCNLRLEAGEDPTIRHAALRTALGWIAANVAAERHPALRVRYEDFVSDPHRTADAIGGWLDLDMATVHTAIETGEVPVAHQIAGNRMKRSDRVRFHLDDEWHQQMPRPQRLLVSTIDGALAHRYGYRLRGGQRSAPR